MVGRGAANQREDAVAVALGIGQAFEHNDAAAFAAPVAVGRRVEALAATVGGQGADLAEIDAAHRRQDHVDAAGEGQSAPPAAQALAREIDGHQRRGTRGVHGERRTLQAEHVRKPTGGHAARRTGAEVSIDLHEMGGGILGCVVSMRHADENSRRTAEQSLRSDAGVLERLPAHLQQQPLLGVHAGGLARGDAEELGIELVDFFEEAAVARVHFAGSVGVGVIERGKVPALGRHLGNRVLPVPHELPERLRVVDGAGKTTGHADDGNRLLAGTFQSGHLGLQVLDGAKRVFQEGGVRASFRRHGSSSSALSLAASRPATSSSESASRVSAGAGVDGADARGSAAGASIRFAR